MVVERDPESGWLVGEIVELPGCLTQAPTMQELEHSIREAISVYLETVQPDEPLANFVGAWLIDIPA